MHCKNTSQINIYLLELQSDGSLSKEKNFIRLPPPVNPYILRFNIRVGSIASQEGILYTNYPIDGSEFDRKNFHSKRFPIEFTRPLNTDITIQRAGAFEFYVEYKELNSNLTKSSAKSYFTVDPLLHIIPRHRILSSEPISSEPTITLPIDGLAIQSVLPKLLGRFSEWDPHIKVISDLGYNMIHFLPMQVRGMSNSPYSIYDQLSFSNDLFEPKDRSKSPEEKIEIIKKTLNKIEHEYKILSLTDIVWNHTACNCNWLEEHPEAGYNLINSPHLTPAYELDTVLLEYSSNLSKLGFPTRIKTEKDLDSIIEGVKEHVIKKIRLWEFYVINVKEALTEFKEALNKPWPPSREDINFTSLSFKAKAKLLAEKALYHKGAFGQRFYKKLNYESSISFILSLIESEDSSESDDDVENGSESTDGGIVDKKPVTPTKKPGSKNEKTKPAALEKIKLTEKFDDKSALMEAMINKFEALVNEINLPLYITYDDNVISILDNLWNRVKYMRLDPHGPKQGEINKRYPLIEPYFTRIPLNNTTKKHPKGALAVANNGWLWNANPLVDFASSESFAYLRREVIVWGDCVKLRYGKSKEDSPWLWDHMTKYTVQLAKLFHGFRIDNCHGTPIHVAQHLLDEARRVRPNLYVVAELFTGSEETDIKYVRALGINSLIREAMQAWDPRELSRLVHRHGGKPIGSMKETECLTTVCKDLNRKSDTQCLVTPLLGSKPHALFIDCSHDNETPHQKRVAEDTLSNGALVAMSSCAIGSVKGYDEIYPQLVDLVNETRPYELHEKPLDIGIGRVKKVLQHLHTEMILDGYIETHVHHENDYIIVHRLQPHNNRGYLLIAHCAFSKPTAQRGELSPVKLRGTRAELIFSTHLKVHSREFTPRKDRLSGLSASLESLNGPNMRRISDDHGYYTEVTLPKEFPSGSVMLMKTWVDKQHNGLDEFLTSDVEEPFRELDLVDLNIVLHRCNGEENDVTPGHGVYNIPGYGDLPYCGLEGFMLILRHVMKHNDLGHPLCSNLREGHWALDYVANRLERYLEIAPKLKKLIKWYKERFDAIKTAPNFLIPKYFALTIKSAYEAAINRILEQSSPFVYEGGPFIQSLALCSVQMYGTVLSTGLHPTEIGPSMAAGLPHFTYKHMRCWGRDVFISLRGLFITTGNFEAAKRHIIGFASVLKHGLIPNLLDAARRPRYNCRDASWWFLQSIQEYCKFSPEGIEFLKTSVLRRFPKNDEFVEVDDPLAYKYESTILEIIQEIVERHAKGIHFKEWNAGPKLDHAMTEKGFQVDIQVDWETGLLFGGNKFNCGTWMDKMGESEKAGNKGIPATPRDGAAVEIIGLLKSTLRWLSELSEQGHYPWKGVGLEDGRHITFAEWNDLIQKSFEKCFYIPLDPADDSKYELNTKINRRGIYKDTYKASNNYEDYQLRPNFPIAMVVAPELFNNHHALQALNIAREKLAGPLGMRSLDPRDWAYRGIYDNNNDSDDKSIAKGWNYHQGPEWLWCTGYFLRAYLYFDTLVGKGKENPHKTICDITQHLLPHSKIIEKSPWAGLPELTNANGAECHHSCPTQAWSSATLLDLFDDIKKLERILNN
ncbi:glycoside hydrolase family 13/133 protein [Glomus cerebriforme]|uniref:Glycogen debranching enzyme n=1 Tax=Glomus cerebriforme TaxID=658196 RepID=A0A397SKF6_9GLOM|nr:glycoside hydrolase family 13/133 protein [Glomus cerebriforme]